MAPLAGGVLSGKYSREKSKTSRGGEVTEERLRIADAVSAVAKEIGASSSQVALAWLLQQPGIVIPIIGTRKEEQLRDNLASVDLKLDGEQMKKLDEASKIDLGFPGRFLMAEGPRRYLSGGMSDQIDRPGARL